MPQPHYLGATQVNNTSYAALFLKMDLQFAVTHLYIIKTVGKCRPETCMPLDPDRVARCVCTSELLTNSPADL